MIFPYVYNEKQTMTEQNTVQQNIIPRGYESGRIESIDDHHLEISVRMEDIVNRTINKFYLFVSVKELRDQLLPALGTKKYNHNVIRSKNGDRSIVQYEKTYFCYSISLTIDCSKSQFNSQVNESIAEHYDNNYSFDSSSLTCDKSLYQKVGTSDNWFNTFSALITELMTTELN